MNKIVAVAGAAVVLGGLAAAVPQPTRTPPTPEGVGRRRRRHRPDGHTRPPGATRGAGAAGSARTRCGGVRAHERHGTATQWRARHPGGVPAREARDRGRLRRHVVAALAGGVERAAGVWGRPWPVERMVCADCQPRHAAARRVGRSGLRCHDVVTDGKVTGVMSSSRVSRLRQGCHEPSTDKVGLD